MYRHNRQSNTARFSAMTADELIAKAREWDQERQVRGAQQVGDYRLDLNEGALTNRATGEVRHCDEVRRWDNLPGVVVFIGCDCEDERYRLAPLRAAMDAKGCGTACYCKHHYTRALHAGHTLLVAGKYRVRVKQGVVK